MGLVSMNSIFVLVSDLYLMEKRMKEVAQVVAQEVDLVQIVETVARMAVGLNVTLTVQALVKQDVAVNAMTPVAAVAHI